MADLYTKKPHTAFESEAMAEKLFSDIQNATDSAIDKIAAYEKRIAVLNARIERNRKNLLDLLSVNNLDPNIVTFSQVSGNPIYPDGKTEDGTTYVTSDDANKTWSVPGMMALRELAERDPVSSNSIRNLNDIIKKDTNMLGLLTKRVEVLRNLNNQAIKASEDSKEDFDKSKTYINDMRKLYKFLADFRNVIASIPVDVTTSANSKKSEEVMAVNCKSYVDTRTSSINLLTGYTTGDTYAEDKDMLEELLYILSFIEERTPTQYSECFSDPAKYVSLLTEVLGEVMTLIKAATSSINSLYDNKINSEIVTLKNSVLTVLRSSVKKSIVESVNQEQRISINKESIVNKDSAVKSFVGTMERLGAAVRSGNQNLDKLLNEQPRDLVKKAVIASGFPVAATKSGRDALRDHVRERVRAKYGGDIPFCDEVIVYGSNGVKEFVKRSEAVEVSDGVYEKASDVTKDKFLRNYMDDESNIWG